MRTAHPPFSDGGVVRSVTAMLRRFVGHRDARRPNDGMTMRQRLLRPLTRPSAPSVAPGIVAAAVVIVFETAAVVLLRHVLSTECFESLYLPGVLVVSAVWGVTLATATSLASAVALAYFHNWPTVPLMPLDLDNAVVVVVFLGVALLTNLAAGTARRRSAE